MKKELRIRGLTSESHEKLNQLANKMGVPPSTYAKMVLFNHIVKENQTKENQINPK